MVLKRRDIFQILHFSMKNINVFLPMPIVRTRFGFGVCFDGQISADIDKKSCCIAGYGTLIKTQPPQTLHTHVVDSCESYDVMRANRNLVPKNDILAQKATF